MRWVLRSSLTLLLLAPLCQTVRGQAATVEGHVECDEDCSIQGLRVRGEIVNETVSAIQCLFSEVHRQAERQKKEVRARPQLHINSQGGGVYQNHANLCFHLFPAPAAA
jgi:hypothetical protein